MRILDLYALLCAILFSSCALGSPAGKWEQCLEQIPNEDLSEAEERGGKLYVNEYLIDRCGFRPVVTHPNGNKSLRKEDCNQLFEWLQDGTCAADDMAEVQKAILKQLDPAAFNEKQYFKVCTAINAAGAKPIGRTSFGRKVCQK